MLLMTGVDPSLWRDMVRVDRWHWSYEGRILCEPQASTQERAAVRRMYSCAVDVEVEGKDWSPWAPRGEQHAFSHDQCPRSSDNADPIDLQKHLIAGLHLTGAGLNRILSQKLARNENVWSDYLTAFCLNPSIWSADIPQANGRHPIQYFVFFIIFFPFNEITLVSSSCITFRYPLVLPLVKPGCDSRLKYTRLHSTRKKLYDLGLGLFEAGAGPLGRG
jgi:hypothetical protein